MGGQDIWRNPLHPIYFNICRLSTRFCIGHLGDAFFVNLKHVNGHAAGSGEFLVADMAFEVLSLLMLNQNLFVIELPIAIVTPHL